MTVVMRSRHMLWVYCVLFFFFQAEDGIRDIGVTGVQTCALPIFQARLVALARAHDLLTRESWEGAALGDVVRAALEAGGGRERGVEGKRGDFGGGRVI